MVRSITSVSLAVGCDPNTISCITLESWEAVARRIAAMCRMTFGGLVVCLDREVVGSEATAGDTRITTKAQTISNAIAA